MAYSVFSKHGLKPNQFSPLLKKKKKEQKVFINAERSGINYRLKETFLD